MGATGAPVRVGTWRHWVNRGLVVLGVLYVLFVAMMLALTGLFTYVGIDYRALWCSLDYSHALGFARAYDPAAQAQFHLAVDPLSPGHVACDTPPAPYLPVFLLLFEPLALVPPAVGYVLWTLLNVVLFLAYCYRFAGAVGGDRRPAALLRYLLAYALFENLVAGQVNVLLFVCLGECVLACVGGRDSRAGVWLAGLLLKPQTLLLVGPGLLLQRRLRLLVGFCAAGLALAAGSLLLAGVDGLLGLVRLLQYYSGGVQPSFPEAGMNWRGLAINLTPLLGETGAWAICLPGLALTALAGLALWLAPRRGRSPETFVIALLGSFAATSATIWHSHVYSGLPLLAPLLYLRARGRLPDALFDAWIALPAAAFFIGAFGVTPTAGHPAAGMTMLAVNVALVAWAAHALWRPGGVTVEADRASREPERDVAPQPSRAH